MSYFQCLKIWALRKLNNAYYAVRPPKRLYRWGTCGLAYFDDRTGAERVWDTCDDVLAAWIKRASTRRRSRGVWHSFYDVCSETYVTCMADIKKIEREKGLIYMDKLDIPKEAARNRARNEAAQHEYFKAKFTKAVHELEHGRSYLKELRDSGRLKEGGYDPKYGEIRN